MDKDEIQAEILKQTRVMFRLAGAISKLPESKTRADMVASHDTILLRVNGMQITLSHMVGRVCFYGFEDECPGMPCRLCKHWRVIVGGQSEQRTI